MQRKQIYYCILGTNMGGQNIPSKFILNHDEAKGKRLEVPRAHDYRI